MAQSGISDVLIPTIYIPDLGCVFNLLTALSSARTILIENEIEFHFHNRASYLMFSALVVTLREGVEAALIVGITLVYLTKIGRPDLRRTVYAALIAAVIGSVAGAVALSYAPIN